MALLGLGYVIHVIIGILPYPNPFLHYQTVAYFPSVSSRDIEIHLENKILNDINGLDISSQKKFLEGIGFECEPVEKLRCEYRQILTIAHGRRIVVREASGDDPDGEYKKGDIFVKYWFDNI